MRFDFDPQKSARNKDKHGIDFVEAQALWLGYVAEAPAQVVDGEMRYLNIGLIGNKHCTAVITHRGPIRRIISVYPSSSRQIESYERSRTSKA